MEEVIAYVLCRERSARLGEAILARFAPTGSATESEYPYAEDIDPPEAVFDDPRELMQRLEADQEQSRTIYWDNRSSIGPIQVILRFTVDSSLIAGLVVPEPQARAWLLELADAGESELGFITGDDPPPFTAAEFVRIWKVADLRL